MTGSEGDGAMSFSITAYDIAGNSLTVDQTVLTAAPNVTKDFTNPVVSITAPTANKLEELKQQMQQMQQLIILIMQLMLPVTWLTN